MPVPITFTRTSAPNQTPHLASLNDEDATGQADVGVTCGNRSTTGPPYPIPRPKHTTLVPSPTYATPTPPCGTTEKVSNNPPTGIAVPPLPYQHVYQQSGVSHQPNPLSDPIFHMLFQKNQYQKTADMDDAGEPIKHHRPLSYRHTVGQDRIPQVVENSGICCLQLKVGSLHFLRLPISGLKTRHQPKLHSILNIPPLLSHNQHTIQRHQKILQKLIIS